MLGSGTNVFLLGDTLLGTVQTCRIIGGDDEQLIPLSVHVVVSALRKRVELGGETDTTFLGTRPGMGTAQTCRVSGDDSKQLELTGTCRIGWHL